MRLLQLDEMCKQLTTCLSNLTLWMQVVASAINAGSHKESTFLLIDDVQVYKLWSTWQPKLQTPITGHNMEELGYTYYVLSTV